MTNKVVNLNIEQARELFVQHPEYRTTLLSVFTDEELGIQKEWPKDWYNLKEIKGCYIAGNSDIETANNNSVSILNLNVFANEKYAESALAYAQLSQLAKEMNDGWEPNWSDGVEYKYSVCFKNCRNSGNNSIQIVFCWLSDISLIYFKTREMAEFSIKHHRNLWEKFYMI